MEPDYEFRFDENNIPVAIIGAFGKRLPEELPLDRMQQINEKVSEAANTFISECIKANQKLRKVLPGEANEKAYAVSFLYYQLHLHQEETGDKITVVEPGQLSNDWAKGSPSEGQVVKTGAEEARSEHKQLAEKYDAYDGGLREDDLNRAFVVMACENFVLREYAKVGSRAKVVATPTKLWDAILEDLPFAEDVWEGALLPTLIEDGWVLFRVDDGSVRVLPYGSGVPGYDPDLGIDHPAWARNPEVAWP